MWQQPPSQGLLHIKKNKKAAKGPGIEVDVDGITPSPPPHPPSTNPSFYITMLCPYQSMQARDVDWLQ